MNKLIKAILVNLVVIGTGFSIVYFFSGPINTSTNKPATSTLGLNKPAPLFSGVDSNGNSISLSDFSGQPVVLEWKNHLCPFVIKHYSSGNMQSLQKTFTDEGVIWLSVISSAPGKQGHVSNQECNDIIEKEKSHATAVILDSTGAIGKLYQAKTTPHMYVIDSKGVLVYMGAIDSIRSTNPSDIINSKNYVSKALLALRLNKDVNPNKTSAYGCSVKY